ncbi:MAG TPA: aquaporin [Candidatus Limnocylindrales bacterium]|nr:aquaporin [Candidatus Limnocylindrales bacterium]
MNPRALIAELLGTFTLVAMGSLAIVSANGSSIPPLLIAPFGFGLGLLAAIVMFGDVSGGHFNPAVTLAAWIDRRIGLVGAIGYVIAQVLGALVASMTILVLFGKELVDFTRNTPASVLNDVQVFGVEAVLTAIFITVILTITARSASQALFVIPLTLLMIHFAAIPISGASVNPARALGPAIVSGNYEHLWVYLTAPFLGALIGWGLYRLMATTDDGDASQSDDVADELFDELDDDDMDAAPTR